MILVPPGMSWPVVVLRGLLFVLPCAALAFALPQAPHWMVILLVVATGAVWARSPDHVSGAIALGLVAGWWGVHGVVDWRLLVVGVLLVAAHVSATLLAHGPGTLAVDPRLARLWVGRGLLALVPMPVTWLAVRGLDPALAPRWVWIVAGVAIMGLLVTAARLTQPEPE